MSNGSPNKTSTSKIIGTFLGIFLILFLLCVLCLPMFFSTTAGKKILLKMISNRTGLQIEMDALSLSWFGSQTVKGIHVQKKQEQLDFTAPEIQTDAALWKIVFLNHFGQMQITAPNLQMSKPFPSTARIRQKSFQSAALSVTPKLAIGMSTIELPIKGKIIVREGKVGFNSLGLEPITFDQITLSMDIASKEELALALSCTTSQQGQIAIKGSASHLNAPFPNLYLQSTINQLPVRGIDQLVSLVYPEVSGLIYSFLGPTINLGCNLNASAGNFDLRLNAISPQITAYVATQSLNGVLSLKSPAEIHFNLTPLFLQKAAKLYPSLSHFALSSPVLFQTTVEQFSCSVPSRPRDLLNSTFQAKLTAPPQISLLFDNNPLIINNLNITSQRSSLEQQLAATLTAGIKTDVLEVPAFNLSLDSSLTLTSPSQIALTLNPKALNQRLPQYLQLTKTAAFQGSLHNLMVPLQNIRNSHVDLIVNAGPIVLNGPRPLNVAKVQADLAIKTFNQISLQISGGAIQASLTGAYNPTSALFTLTQPFTAQYTIDPQTFQTLIPTASQLVKPSTFQLSIDPFAFSISALDVAKLKMKGQLSNDEMMLRTQDKQIVLQNTTLPFQWDGAGKTAQIQLISQVQNPSGGPGSMQGQFNLSNFSTDKGLDLASVAIQGALDLQNLSSTLLDTFTGKHLSTVTGPTFSSKFKWQSMPDKQQLSVKWVSPNLNIDTGFTLDSSLQLQNGNNQMIWTLTPEGYRALDQLLTSPANGLIPFEIKEASTFTIALSKLSLPLIEKPRSSSLIDRFSMIDFELAKLQLSATGRNPKLTFDDQSSHDTIQLTNMNFSLNKNDKNPLSVSMDSSVLTQGNNAPTKNGSISLNGQLEQILTAQGTFDFSKLTGSLQFKAQQLPSRALDIIARAKGRSDFPFTTLFGNMINATLSIQLDQFSGPVSLNVNTPLTRADISGTIKNGALILKDAIHVQMKMTPEISRLLLKEVNPLNLSYIYSQEPITMIIPAVGFYFPLYPFDLAKITMPNARIELGKIACRNEGNVNIALRLLRNKQFEKSNDLILWFAPIDLSVKQGIADIERTEILLADTFDICLWGNVDLVKDYIDMSLGLTAQTLSKAFGIKNLPENYVLRIPMYGKADNVQIDTGKATAKITMLLAWQQASATGALGKGPAGAIIGGLINKMATLPDADAKVPPPKHPFPWEIGKSKLSHDSTAKKKQFKADEKPLKQILKLIR